ncbi:MAG: Mrp/NBP35 family ATP-binding protein [Actinomycetota bacterium]|nr:Mrp/NBP35 family ATP-binding protein [Actinomycetota bacterium]
MKERVTVITPAQAREALRIVLDPEIGRPIEDLGMLADVQVSPQGDVDVHVLLTIAGCPLKDRLERDVTAALEPLEGVRGVRVSLSPMSEEQRQQLVASLRGQGGNGHDAHAGHDHGGHGAPQAAPTFFTDGATQVIAVASGKGGVGKSSVTANLAVALGAEGHRVGVLDADVWGFSIPRMMGAAGQPVAFNNMMLPLEAHGVKVISMGFFVDDETPVIWRGPMLHKAIQQFLGDVYWGDLDFLLVDLPPGTGDVSLSLAMMIPQGSMLVVTTPQDAARKVAERAGRMAQHPNINLDMVGVVENMSGFVCPHCDEITEVFGTGGGAQTARALGTDLLGQVPMQVSLREGSDTGTPVVVSEPESPAGAAFRRIAAEVLARKPKRSLVGKPLGLTVAR